MIFRNSCLASMDLNKCGTSRGGIRCKWGDNQTWSRNPEKHLWRSKWSWPPVNNCVFSLQISCSIQLFLSSDLVTNLALPPTAWQDNFDFPGLATWTTEARQHVQLFHSLLTKNTIFQGRVVQPFQLCERRSQGGFSRNASLEHVWPSWAHGINWSYGRVPGYKSFF